MDVIRQPFIPAFVDSANAVNWTHSINKGLRFWLTYPPGTASGGGKHVDLVRGYPCTPVGFTASQRPLVNTSTHGNVLNFQQTSQYVSCALSLDQVWPLTQGTISFWKRKTDGTNRTSVAFGSYNDSGGASGGPRVLANLPSSDGNIYFDFGGFGNRLTISGQTWDQLWHHWVFTVGPAGQYCYKDGILIGNTTTAVTRAALASNFLLINYFPSIGGGSPTTGDLCAMADIRVWNRQITGTDVKTIFSISKMGYVVPNSPLNWVNMSAFASFAASGGAWPWFLDSDLSGGFDDMGL